MAGRSRPASITSLALAAAGTAMAAIAMAAIHYDGDVGVVLIVLDKALVGVFTQLWRNDTVNQLASI